MPANIMLPTKAKIAAFVCNGRSRPKVSHSRSKLNRCEFSWQAMKTPADMPTAPQNTEATRNIRTTRSLYSITRAPGLAGAAATCRLLSSSMRLALLSAASGRDALGFERHQAVPLRAARMGRAARVGEERHG